MTVLFDERTVQTDTIFQGRVFSVEVLRVELHDGRPARREIVRHNGGACVVALDDENRVYLVSQYRKPYDCELLELPAGKLEPGEDPRDCAVRELAEETGLKAKTVEWLATVYPSPGYCSEILTIYLATGLSQGEASLDEGEHLSCQAIPLTTALAMVERGEVPDAKTQVGLMAVARKLDQAERQSGED